MAKYKVKLMFMYSDTVEVEANSKDEADKLALEEDYSETFESFYDSEVTKL